MSMRDTTPYAAEDKNNLILFIRMIWGEAIA